MTRILTIASLFTAILFASCSKNDKATAPTGTTVSQSTTNTANANFAFHARYSGADYSQSIPVDSANRMIQSYLTSVSYPAQDNSIRAMSFDADTLRAYLADPSITTVKFVMAHQPQWINGGHYGEYGGLSPKAVTMIIVGVNDATGAYVRNRYNGVYEHTLPCPSNCGPGASANPTIQ